MMKAAMLLFFLLGSAAVIKADSNDNLIIVNEKDPAATIHSPNYPSNYPNDVTCTWLFITGGPGLQIEIEVLGYEGRILTEGCCDYVEVRDGTTEDSPLLTTLRGNTTERNFLSTYGGFFIKFVSDETDTDTGFELRYRAVEDKTTCGENIVAGNQTQIFTFPDTLGEQYPNNSLCNWDITAPVGYQVVFWFQSLDSEHCCDYLQIRDGTDVDSTLNLFAAGRGIRFIPSIRFISSKSILNIRFRSNDAISYNGFVARYTTVPDSAITTIPTIPPSTTECGAKLEAPGIGHGNFSTPNYPNVHGGDLMCQWILSAPEGLRIRLWFSFVHTESCCDWIIVRDGTTRKSDKLGIISGTTFDFHSFLSTGNMMRVDYNTNGNINGRGFNAFFEIYTPGADEKHSECGGELRADDTLQYISTPNWPMRYPVNTTCLWIIQTASLNGRVRVHMMGINTDIFQDEVSVYDGPSVRSRRIVTFSGNHRNQFFITSSQPFITINFHSGLMDTRGGFRASYTQVPGTPPPPEEGSS